MPAPRTSTRVHRDALAQKQEIGLNSALRALEALDDDELVTLHRLLSKMTAEPGDGAEDARGW